MPEIVANSGLLKKTKVHVEDTGGSQRPVVLIHGWPLSGASWSSQVNTLKAAGYRVITYDRRGFGQSDKPGKGYDYDTLADDLSGLIEELDLHDVTLVGFSMGGGEVARYIARHGEERIRSVVFAGSVTPYMAKSKDNPDGPLVDETASAMKDAIEADRTAFFDDFTKGFFSANGVLKVSEAERQDAIALCNQSDEKAAVECMKAFATTDFREDLPKINVPTLVMHGDSDATVPIEGSGAITAKAIAQASLVVFNDAPHGFNVSHKDEFNQALLDFLGK